jgi:hypothetical protein
VKTSASPRRIPPLLRDVLLEVGIIAILAAGLFLVMKMANKRLGLDEPDSTEEVTATSAQPDSLVVPQMSAPEPRSAAVEGPETGWPVTPCSLYTSGSSRAVVRQLPQAPSGAEIPYEALLVARAWALECGASEDDLQKVWVFNRQDTLYVDIPSEYDFEGLRRTVEGRFVCFTRLFVLVGGSLYSSAEGISVRGVEGGLAD